jgi:hypothetical protein
MAEKDQARGARNKALLEAETHFGVSREKAEKAHKYYKDREIWIAEKERIIGEAYVDDVHRMMAWEASSMEYDQLHARSPQAPAKHLLVLRDHFRDG